MGGSALSNIMSKLVLALVSMISATSLVLGQAKTAAQLQDAPFSQLTSNTPDGAIRHCINCQQTNPCTASTDGTQATAQKLNGAWFCSGSGTSTGVSSVTGTSNQVNTSAPSGNITLSLPQNIATTSTPRFTALG